jgi:hypothetical protein
MKTMVEQVVEILDEGSFYLLPGRILRSRVPKKRQPLRKIRKTLPQTTTGEKEILDKSKEKQRKDVKDRHPNTPLKWDGHRWTTYQKQKEQLEDQVQPIDEISLRTGLIGGFLMKVKQYGNKVDQGVSKLKSLSSSLQNASDEKERNRITSEIVRTDADVLSSLRKMEMYSSLVSASGGLGVDRTYNLLKKMEKQKRR